MQRKSESSNIIICVYKGNCEYKRLTKTRGKISKIYYKCLFDSTCNQKVYITPPDVRYYAKKP